MAIDPIAVSGGAAAKLPTATDTAAQSNVAGNDGANFENAAFENAALKADERVDLLDYTNQQKGRNGLSLDVLDADGKARYLANPATLGEKVLNYMEKFHDRFDGDQSLWNDKSRLQASTTLAGHASVPSGPAALVPEQATSMTSGSSASQSGLANQGGNDGFLDQLAQMRDLAELSSLRKAEAHLVGGIAQQFSKSMGMLLRGQ